MWYIYTNEDKMKAFDNAMSLLVLAAHEYAYSRDTKRAIDEFDKRVDELRQMFWNELEHDNEVPN